MLFLLVLKVRYLRVFEGFYQHLFLYQVCIIMFIRLTSPLRRGPRVLVPTSNNFSEYIVLLLIKVYLSWNYLLNTLANIAMC